jgi:hypothetical protein
VKLARREMHLVVQHSHLDYEDQAIRSNLTYKGTLDEYGSIEHNGVD